MGRIEEPTSPGSSGYEAPKFQTTVELFRTLSTPSLEGGSAGDRFAEDEARQGAGGSDEVAIGERRAGEAEVGPAGGGWKCCFHCNSWDCATSAAAAATQPWFLAAAVALKPTALGCGCQGIRLLAEHPVPSRRNRSPSERGSASCSLGPRLTKRPTKA